MTVEASGGENEDLERRRQLFDTLSAQARTDQQASSDSFDNQLLTYSSALLGLSLAFIKDIVPLSVAIWLPCLYSSWILLAFCILSTIASFRFGIEAQKKHDDHLFKYYIEKNEAYFNKKSRWSDGITICAYVGAVTFFLAVVLTIFFAVKNISYVRNHAQQEHSEVKAGSATTGGNGSNERGATASQDGPAQRGAERQAAGEHDSCCTPCETCAASPQKPRKRQAGKPKVNNKRHGCAL